MNPNKKVIKFAVLLIILGLVAGISDIAGAKEKIVWPYVCFKPVYICENDRLVAGIGHNILKMVWSKMPEYEHEFVQMPIKRIIESAKQGKHQLFYGLYKTAEREKYFEFSLPCRISTPKFLVVRKADLSTFGNGKQVSLEQLLKDEHITFLHLKSISFGRGIDGLLELYKDRPNILTEYDTTNVIPKSIKLLLNRRADAMLSLDGTRYDAREMGASDKLAFISIKEQDHWDVGHIVAPKNEWGKQVIDQINIILCKEIKTEAFFGYFKPLVDEDMLPKLRQKYNEHILAPSLN